MPAQGKYNGKWGLVREDEGEGICLIILDKNGCNYVKQLCIIIIINKLINPNSLEDLWKRKLPVEI